MPFITAGARCKVFKQLSGQVVLITGGNSGVGKYAAIELASKGATVLIGSFHVISLGNLIADSNYIALKHVEIPNEQRSLLRK